MNYHSYHCYLLISINNINCNDNEKNNSDDDNNYDNNIDNINDNLDHDNYTSIDILAISH